MGYSICKTWTTMTGALSTMSEIEGTSAVDICEWRDFFFFKFYIEVDKYIQQVSCHTGIIFEIQIKRLKLMFMPNSSDFN